MYALFEITTRSLLKNLLVCTTFLWISCESRHLLGIGTRLGGSSDGEYVLTYSTWNKGEVGGHSDRLNDDFGRPQHNIPPFMIIFFILFAIVFILTCLCACARRQRLWANVDANPSSRPAFEVYPPVSPLVTSTASPRPGFQVYPPVAPTAPSRPAFEGYTPVTATAPVAPPATSPVAGIPVHGGQDVNPPDYAAVTHPRTMPTHHYDGLIRSPATTTGNNFEEPPPSYWTVAPFK